MRASPETWKCRLSAPTSALLRSNDWHEGFSEGSTVQQLELQSSGILQGSEGIGSSSDRDFDLPPLMTN